MYTQSITRSQRAAFVILIDASGSMSEEIIFRGRHRTKAEAVASITNDLLFELIERAHRDDGVRDYYDVAIVGYSGSDEVYSLLGEKIEMTSIKELAQRPCEIHREVVELRLPDGGVSLREIPTPQWVKPHAVGQTPMCEALRVARDLVDEWCRDPCHVDSFPPVVFNITDGEATDCNDEELKAVAQQIKDLSTSDGNALLINIHLAPDTTASSLFFPSKEEQHYPNRYAGVLWECSSEMPQNFNDAIREAKGYQAMPPFRGMSFNASVAELITMLNIGSISVKTE